MKSKLLLVIAIVTIAWSCQQNKPTEVPASNDSSISKKGMICVTIFYANGEGKTFDMDYYAKTHMPLVKESCGDALKFIEIDKGIGGGAPDSPATYAAIGYLYFDSVESYRSSIGPHIEKIRADIPKFTNIAPVIQISEVVQ